LRNTKYVQAEVIINVLKIEPRIDTIYGPVIINLKVSIKASSLFEPFKTVEP